MKGLTKRQRELIDYIHNFILNNRYSPSYREIQTHFGFSSLGSVYKHINTLKKRGALFNESKVSRSLTTTEPPKQLIAAEVTIPLIGYISAKEPIQTFSQSEQIQVPLQYVHSPDKTYALKVQGDSFKEELIVDGDILLVEVRDFAHPGETIIALVNGNNIMLKKYYRDGEYVKLLGSCSQHNPILLRQEDFMIQAVLVSLIRLYG